MQMSMKKHDRILVISDLHFPYSHPEAIDFLSKLKSIYKPTYIVNIGDEVDMHSINVSHLVDPDLPSPHDELEIARSWIKRLEKLFIIFKLNVHTNHLKDLVVVF